MLEKAALPEGATWHAAGLVGQLRSSRNTTRMLQKSVAMYDGLERETGLACDWKEVGIRSVINGPIPYSADSDFVMGPVPEFKNLMLATGFLYGIAAGGGAGEMIAEWLLEGRPSLDLWPLDNRRFGQHHGARAFMYPRAVEHYAHHYKMRYPGAESNVARDLHPAV